MPAEYVVPWLPGISVPEAPDKPKPTSPPPAWMTDETFRYGMATAFGVVGGVAIGEWAFDHLFVEGLEDKERKTLLLVGAVAVLTFGTVKLLDLDEKYLTVEGTFDKASEYITGKAAAK